MARGDAGEFPDHPCQAVDAQPDLEPVGAEIQTRDEQLQRAGVCDKVEATIRAGAKPAQIEWEFALEAMDAKLDQLVAATKVEKGAWWLSVKAGGIIATATAGLA